MAINFPISPSPNEIYSYNGLSWQWNGSYWQSFPPSSGATGVVTSIIASTGLSANTATGNVTLIVTGSTGGGTFSGGTVTGPTIFTNGLTANTISATTYYNVSSNFQYEIHVSQVDGNDTTGNGDLLNPVATITKALTLLIGSRKTILIHPGTYTENVTVANTNITIATSELTGANTLLSGTLTIGTLGSGSRISGLKMTNLVISGTAQAYISNCTVDTQVTKSSSGYVEIINSEMQCISGIQISGSGTTIINGNKNVGISVSNASAQVIVKGCNSVVTPSASAGNLAIVDCIVTALGGNAITITNSATTLTLLNSQVLVQAGNNVAPISVAGIYSIINTIYDKPGSTFTGTSTNSIDYFQSINADKFITQGGTSLQYVMGDGSLSNGFTGGTVSGATNFTGGLTATTISATTYQNLPFSGTVRNSGTTTSNFIPRWTGTTALTNSQIQDDGTNISIGQSPISLYRFFINDLNTGTTNSFVVNGSSAISKTAIRGASNATQYGTGVYGSAVGSVESIGLDGLTLNGTLAIGVRGVASPDEFTNITTGIGGYFASDDSNGYSTPTNRYSVQLKDGTEGTNKVLVSTTSDGKANWSSSLTGLTSVSATTYYNLPISGLTQGSNITITNNGNGNFTIASTGGGGLTFQQVQMIAFLTS
jgi:hypothetical protein